MKSCLSVVPVRAAGVVPVRGCRDEAARRTRDAGIAAYKNSLGMDIRFPVVGRRVPELGKKEGRGPETSTESGSEGIENHGPRY